MTEETEKKKSKTPFDYIKSINEKNDYIWDEDNEKSYPHHVINIGLSFFSDTIFIVNEANKYNITGKKHYDFLYNFIEKRKRWSKWMKKEANSEDLEAVMEYFDMDITKARELLKAIPADKIHDIKTKLRNKGGMRK
jgi:hypothetical protein